MPIDYVRDDANRRIRMTAIPPVTATEVMAALDRQVAEGTWSYTTLVDTRRASLAPEDNPPVFAHLEKLSREHGSSGAVAIVSRDTTTIGATHRMAVATSIPHTIETFWDISEAERWLNAVAQKTSGRG